MIYNINHGLGWASSGVEYAQSYRANILRKAGIPAKFIFTDMFPSENIEHLSKNIGFLDEEIIWLYTFFTDTKIAPVSFTLDDLEKTFACEHYEFTRSGKTAKYVFDNNTYYTVYMVDSVSDKVHRVEIVAGNFLIRKDYYTYCKIYSEYYAPLDNKAFLYARRWFNEDGTTAYEECIDNENIVYKFPNKIICSKEEFIGYMVRCLELTSEDVIIIDRSTGVAQEVFKNCNDARVGSVVHADHFSEGASGSNILWNNYYEYIFAQYKRVSFYITATEAQNELMREHFHTMFGEEPNVVTIPVGSLKELKVPSEPRKKHSLITASRLATEKHCDWLIEAVVAAKSQVPDISLDIYGKGAEEGKLSELIGKYNCSDYVRLMGQQKLDEIYKGYEAYFSASQSEGFGLTLMEAIGSGLPIIGFDVRYGNQTFIDEGENGYKIAITDDMDKKEKIELLTKAVVKMFTEDDMDAFANHSYDKAREFLTEEVEKKWTALLK